MRRRRGTHLSRVNVMRRAILSVAMLLVCGPLHAASGLPSMDEIRRLFDEKKYRETLAAIAKITSSPLKDAKAIDRYGLLMLKGEALFQLKESGLARDVFNDAADEASNPKEIALARATARLAFRSREALYTPKHAKPNTPISVLDPNNRNAAFDALLADELFDLQPTIKTALASKTLLDVAAALTATATVNAVELTATGSDAKTQKLITELKAHAKDLIAAELKRLAAQIDQISQTANQWVVAPDPPGAGGRDRNWRWMEKRGLNSRQRDQLNEAIDTCKQIVPAAQQLASAMGKKSTGNDFAAVVTEAERLQKEAHTVMQANYNETRRERR